MTFTPYIFFNGNCAEALEFYAEVFGADQIMKMPFSDAPPELGFGDDDLLMHAQIDVGDTTLMCSDVPPGMYDGPQQSICVAHQCDRLDDARAKFSKLSDGGEIAMPFEPTFFSSGFGMCKDKFGTHWMVMVNHTP